MKWLDPTYTVHEDEMPIKYDPPARLGGLITIIVTLVITALVGALGVIL